MTKKVAPEEGQEMMEESVAMEPEALVKALEEAKAEAASHWDKLLRKEAELQNIRKRAETDVANARKYGFEKFAEELLVVVDSFDQALGHQSEYEGSAKAIFEGMELTYKVLLDAMSKFGISQINPVDEPFNPQFHEAIMMQESVAHKPNQVIAVVQKGFTVYDRVLRPARVIVAK